MTAQLLLPVQAEIEQAAQALIEGQLVAFPTETVFGLGAAVTCPQAVSNIFKVKGRPSNHPLIAHAHQEFDWTGWVDFSDPLLHERFDKLTHIFWPGPLTLIVPKGPRMPFEVTGGQDSVGVRCPSHQVAQSLLRAVGVPVAAPSANRFGKVSPTRANHVLSELGELIPFVLDGEIPEVGIESTIVSLLEDTPRVLRPGLITPLAIGDALGCEVLVGQAQGKIIRASGTLEKHYSPDAKVCILQASQLAQEALPAKVLFVGHSPNFAMQARTLLSEHPQRVLHVSPSSPELMARELYMLLRRADEEQFDCIVFESPEPTPEWAGVADRLRRAAF